MSLHTWWLFFSAVFLLCGTPGPNMLHVLTRSVRLGVRRTIATMAGCLSAILLVLAASAAGLSAVLVAAPTLFEVIRYAGVAYLLYLGVKAWRGADGPIAAEPGALPAGPRLTAPRLVRDGFLIGLSNPKLLLFATAFFPQFIDGGAPQAPQFAILVTTFAGAELFWYGVYALSGQRLAAFLTRPGLKRLFDRITGGLFLGFGAALLGFRP
ncbi:LysE family translocator [Methylobacterium planeticum]|uniref:LysE family translocator n=1 Tax=Methylobacterium planeticum TaxID=2615211 RepID=A0A6N6MQF7_9HYPH|nr:LysE family translocator [Methylobacterium planeticum]KAB1073624.1 LysE family translocator [Methylobacterium planeticum]